jgi:hypothetical protein
MRLYRDRLTPDGVIAINISNRHMDLEPLVAAHAAELGLSAWLGTDPVRGGWGPYARNPSRWVVLTPRRDFAARFRTPEFWRTPARRAGFPVWTDDRSDVVRLIDWGRARPAW